MKNPLSDIVVRPGFIPADECDQIVAALAGRVPAQLGVGEDDARPRQRVLETAIIPADVAHAGKLVLALKDRSAPIVRLLAPVLAKHGPTLLNAKAASDVPDAVAFEIFAAIDALVQRSDLATLVPTTSALVAYAQTHDDAQLRRLAHLSIVEDVLLPGAIEKTNLLFSRSVDPARVIDVRVGSLHLHGDLAAVLAQVRAALAELDDIAAHALHVALAAAAPETFSPPRGGVGANQARAVVSSIRNVQTVEWADVRPRVEAYTRRFIDEVVLPAYGLSADAVEEVQLLRTTVDGFYRTHNDAERRVEKDGRVTWLKAKKRDVSLVFYLSRSSDYDGGSLWFPELGIDVRPEQGMAVALPSDHRYLHCVREVTRGVRWAVSSWIDCAGCAPVGTIDQAVPWRHR